MNNSQSIRQNFTEPMHFVNEFCSENEEMWLSDLFRIENVVFRILAIVGYGFLNLLIFLPFIIDYLVNNKNAVNIRDAESTLFNAKCKLRHAEAALNKPKSKTSMVKDILKVFASTGLKTLEEEKEDLFNEVTRAQEELKTAKIALDNARKGITEKTAVVSHDFFDTGEVEAKGDGEAKEGEGSNTDGANGGNIPINEEESDTESDDEDPDAYAL